MKLYFCLKNIFQIKKFITLYRIIPNKRDSWIKKSIHAPKTDKEQKHA